MSVPFGIFRPSIHQVMIERPPTRIIYTGKMDAEGEHFVRGCLADMRKVRYRACKFNPNTSLDIGVDTTRDERTLIGD